jgi:hypothetical protein
VIGRGADKGKRARRTSTWAPDGVEAGISRTSLPASGDVCLRAVRWEAHAPVAELDVDEPAQLTGYVGEAVAKVPEARAEAGHHRRRLRFALSDEASHARRPDGAGGGIRYTEGPHGTPQGGVLQRVSERWGQRTGRT